MNYNPIVTEEDRSYDIWSALLKNRIIYFGDDVDNYSANLAIAQLLTLEKEDPDADIHFYINSPGGSVVDGLAIYDVMQFISCNVATYCVGSACSMGAILLTGGAPGKRFMLPNSRVMIHQVSAGFKGTTSDINIQAKEVNFLMDKLMKILANHTGKDADQVRADCDRDYWMSAEEALNYGLIDKILVKTSKTDDQGE